MKKIAFFIIFIFLASVLLSLFFISQNKVKSDKVMVGATIFPLYDLVRSVGGDRISTELIVPPGASPHNFEPTPSLMHKLSSVKAVFKIGLVDDWADALVDKDLLVKVDQNIVFKNIGDEVILGEEDNDDHNDAYDPHYWLVPTNAIVMASNIYQKLSEIDPEGEPVYADNLNKLSAQLLALDEELKEGLAPYKGYNIITFHDAWGYFANEYNLNIVATIVKSPGEELSPGDMRILSDILKKSDVKAIFGEPQASKDIANVLASDFKIPFGILDAEGGATLSDTYLSIMRSNLSSFIKAFQQ